MSVMEFQKYETVALGGKGRCWNNARRMLVKEAGKDGKDMGHLTSEREFNNE